MKLFEREDTICALSTPAGMGAIALVRLSGKSALNIASKLFSKNLTLVAGHTAHFGKIHHNGVELDEALATVFKAPNSFTGEDTVEFSIHGSTYIQQELLQALVTNGARLAYPGEFSQRAFLNGKLDLSQAEAIHDLITSRSAVSHELALKQLRGGFSKEIKHLREDLMYFASMIELELDFAEEDVEFANRGQLTLLVDNLISNLKRLTESFSSGNAIRNGVPVAIVGKPNAGKSTLLNALLNEERAIVSSIAGTTRDTIEDTIIIEGVEFRFIDTAGLRETSDEIEAIGVRRSMDKVKEAAVVIYLFDVNELSPEQLEEELLNIKEHASNEFMHIIPVGNKIELKNNLIDLTKYNHNNLIFISAKTEQNLDALKKSLLQIINTSELHQSQVIVTNVRHYEALNRALQSLQEVRAGIQNGITGDFLAIDIRRALYFLGEIVGEVSTEDLLGTIFGKFCIGK
jgi:tRNA modification GTPase